MEIIIAVVAFIVGAGTSYFVFNNLAKTKASAIISEAKKVAEQIKKEKRGERAMYRTREKQRKEGGNKKKNWYKRGNKKIQTRSTKYQ